MLYKTAGIVLKTSNYAENSVIAKIYTEKFGLQAYIINGVKKPKAKIRMNMLQPLSLLDMVVYHKQNAGIQRIAEASPSPILLSIPYHIVKSSVALFLNEMLYKSLKQPNHEPLLFNFLTNSILYLDQTEDKCKNYALVFLLKLTRFLGFSPDMSFADTATYFDLNNGIFVNSTPHHTQFLDKNNLKNWLKILRCSLTETYLLVLSASDRKFFLEKILCYYAIHIDGFGEVKSHLVLEEVLN
ncbi:MAG: DNA repair protein RecO [Sphingobacteriales bacterium]|nr:MAG: DNA repair protein RecO [Sphingobacteriales bacterium]